MVKVSEAEVEAELASGESGSKSGTRWAARTRWKGRTVGDGEPLGASEDLSVVRVDKDG